MNMIMPKAKIHTEQRGFASIVIALVLILVLALITLGFAQLSRREQQSTLDKQLSTQAYYAAESAINDAVKFISSGGTLTSDPDNCTTLPGYSPDINNGTGTSYSCLIINTEPESIVYTNVPVVEQARNVSFTTSSQLSELTVSWGSNTRTTFRPSGNTSFEPINQWNAPGVLQFSITTLDAVDRDSLINNTFTGFLYPSAGGSGTVSFANRAAPIVSGNCSGSGSHPCNVKITGFNSSRFLIHFLNYYDPSNVAITGKTAAGVPVKFIGGQAVIDATGKAQDVLKRIQVRIPLKKSYDLANFAIQAKDVCKRQQTRPNETTFVGIDGTSAEAGTACFLLGLGGSSGAAAGSVSAPPSSGVTPSGGDSGSGSGGSGSGSGNSSDDCVNGGGNRRGRAECRE